MAFEGDGFFGHLGNARQGHDLKAARIGQDRPVPAHEAVQAAQAVNALGRGAQHQVIGVAQDDAGAGGLDLIDGESLDRGGGADRHEGGGLDFAPRQTHHAAPGLALSGLHLKLKSAHAFSVLVQRLASP